MPRFVNLTPGDPAPHFFQRSASNPRYVFDGAAGRNIVLYFMRSSTDAHARAALAAVYAQPKLFDDVHASFFCVTLDPQDEAEARLANRLPGYRVFWDFDQRISKLYGAWPMDEGDTGFMGRWVVMDPTLRITRVFQFRPDGGDIKEVLNHVAQLPRAGRISTMDVHAPIILLERVFEPEFCTYLIDQYESQDRELSGFMRDIDGKTRLVHDPNHKLRRDFMIESEQDQTRIQAIVRRRLLPEIAKVHQFQATRMERYLVACYAAEDKAHFQPHRDNTTKGTAHRRFAVSINLNDDFDGGEVRFPEYGPRSYKPPPGGAVVFSCSLLHAVTQVTRGKRYAFLPFLYDDAAARLREENAGFLASQEDQGAT